MAEDMTSQKPHIDAVYLEYTKGVIRTLADTDFYRFFMDMMASAENEFQFSNRRAEKIVDIRWVDALEDALPALQNIITSPRNVLKEESVVVSIAQVKRSDPSAVRHLAQHGQMIDDFNAESGDIRPNRMMQSLRDETLNLYENRLVMTTLEAAFHFVKIRYDALMGVLSDEFGAKLKYSSQMEHMTEYVHVDTFLHIKEKDDILATDAKHREIFERISRIYRVLQMFAHSPFAQAMAKVSRVKGAPIKTNILKKNADYRAIVRLYEFLHNYHDVGYAIKIIEQTPEVSESFQQDVFHSAMFQYIILKNYLENEGNRELPEMAGEHRRTLTPKFIKEIIEEITEDYDLPDVEIRKVLIEELTKAQLMKEEAAERRRLVAERAARKREEAERLRREKLAERERLRLEKQAEQERLHKEEEAARARLVVERMERDLEDNLRGRLFRRELDRFAEHLSGQLDEREAENRAVSAKRDLQWHRAGNGGEQP